MIRSRNLTGAVCLAWAIHLSQGAVAEGAVAEGAVAKPFDTHPQMLLSQPFVVTDIRVQGLQRIPVAKVFRMLPFAVGESFDPSRVPQIIHNVFASGDFENVEMRRLGDAVIIVVSERPSISAIDISGNKAITEDDLLEGLKRVGLAKGSVFKRATLERVQVEMERQYVAQGRYGARVTAELVPMSRNRVKINIDVKEGKVASIKHVNIVGNQAFSKTDLLDLFQLKESHFWSFFKGDDKYARERLAGDLENLRSFYMDRGYINFKIESTQVSIDPEKEHIYISVNIVEGERYEVGSVTWTGRLPVPDDEIERLIVVRQDQFFSRRLVTLSEDLIAKHLGNAGFTFANVKAVTQIEDGRVDLNFFIDAGQRVYVRRIEFSGNQRTRDEVLRREMRQMEGAWASGEKIELSKTRLERLGFFKGVRVSLDPVPGTEDQVDVKYAVEEQPSGSIGASIGYQNGAGIVFGANLSQRNFLGTGNQVSFALQRNDIRDSYNFSFLDPYFTVHGVSRGYGVYFSETDFSERSEFSRFRADAKGANMTFGYPINEDERISFSLGVDNTKIIAFDASADEVKSFIGYNDAFGGNQSAGYDSYTLTSSWRRSTLNKGLLPDQGSLNRLALELALPGSDLEYYKLTYQGDRYQPITKSWVLRFRTELGFGDGYQDTAQLPFYKHFYSGGIGSIRGFDIRSIGPRDSAGDPFGGDLLTEGSVEMIFHTPFLKDKRSTRTAFFLDFGSVFDTERRDEPGNDIAFDELRYSLGFGFTWITAIGPITMSFAKAFNETERDEKQFFDFSLGQTF